MYFILFLCFADTDGNSSSDDESPPRNPNDNHSPPSDAHGDVHNNDDSDNNHNDVLPSTSSSAGPHINLAVPSTSTGITDNGNGKNVVSQTQFFFD